MRRHRENTRAGACGQEAARGTCEAPSLEDELALGFVLRKARPSGALGVPTQVRSTAFTGHSTGLGAQAPWAQLRLPWTKERGPNRVSSWPLEGTKPTKTLSLDF